MLGLWWMMEDDGRGSLQTFLVKVAAVSWSCPSGLLFLRFWLLYWIVSLVRRKCQTQPTACLKDKRILRTRQTGEPSSSSSIVVVTKECLAWPPLEQQAPLSPLACVQGLGVDEAVPITAKPSERAKINERSGKWKKRGADSIQVTQKNNHATAALNIRASSSPWWCSVVPLRRWSLIVMVRE